MNNHSEQVLLKQPVEFNVIFTLVRSQMTLSAFYTRGNKKQKRELIALYLFRQNSIVANKNPYSNQCRLNLIYLLGLCIFCVQHDHEYDLPLPGLSFAIQ